MYRNIEEKIIGGIFGVAVGEAEAMALAGAQEKKWSRSTGLCLCTADGLLYEKSFGGFMQNYDDFINDLKFAPPLKNYSIGEDVEAAIDVFKKSRDKTAELHVGSQKTGYGSVVRMIPVIIYLGEIDFLGCELGHNEMRIIHDAVRHIHDNSISIVACAIYVTVGRLLLGGFSVEQSIYEGIRIVSRYYSGSPYYRKALLKMRDLYNIDIFRLLPEAAIYSSEDSIRVVEAAIWCLINTESYEECIRRGKALGGACDVVCSAAGGLAGLCYGINGIPQMWLRQLNSQRYIKEVSKKMAEKFR